MAAFTEWAEKAGLSALERSWGRHRLTVLAYHRVRDPDDFRFFSQVISATPQGFADQMDLVAERYNAISLNRLLSWLRGGPSLPENPLLITFDDGYKDNLEHALPALRSRDLPAVIFLSTDFVGRTKPFFWDAAAHHFRQTERTEADLPILGPRRWVAAEPAAAEWIEAAKRVSLSERNEALEALPVVLGTALPDDAYSDELLNWVDVREMAGMGIEFGSHTLTHPILSGLPTEQASRELTESRRRLEDELGTEIRSIAYPNGTVRDFSPEIEQLSREAGYQAAFSLLPGPARNREVQSNPFAIRRVALYLADTDRRFRAKVAGGGRLRPDLS